MVRVVVKRGDQAQFLIEVPASIDVKALIENVCEIYNYRLKVFRIADQLSELAEHGVSLPPNMQGLTDDQVEELRLVDEWGQKCIPSGGFVENKDTLGRRNGKAPTEKMADILTKTIASAKSLISKEFVEQGKALTRELVNEAFMMLSGAVTIVYPMGLPPYDPIQMELKNEEDLSGTHAGTEVIPVEDAALWFSGKEILPGKLLSDYIGKNEKTKIIVKIQKRGAGAPAREAVISEADQRALMAFYYRRQEELKKLEENDDDSYLNSAWSEPGQLKRQFHGLVSTPWFECWRHLFISNLGCYDHEFLTRYLGCLFVVTTRNPDTLGAFSSLVQQQAQLLESQPFRWFSPTNIVKFFVLINDPDMMPVTDQSDPHVSLLDGTNSAAGSASVYPDDAPELQMRKLADLLFLFQQYESAHQIYDLVKRDFKQKSAWLYYAGTQEMSALSTYLQGAVSQRQYPQHQMDDAILTYVTKCKNSDLALRAVLLHTEALKSRELFAETAVCFIRLADVGGFMAGGMLLEQAAHCNLRGKRPLLRHFAMRMALAGVRFARAKQPHLSARSFSLALEILSPIKSVDSGWTLVIDHVNENLARQQLLLNQPREALQSLWHLLSPHSCQLEAAQSRFLREFLNILNKVNSSGEGRKEWLELGLPIFEKNHAKVLLGTPTRKMDDDCSVEARGTAFSDNEHEDAEDARTFTAQRSSLPHNFATLIFPSFVPTTDIPVWMVSTDVPSVEERRDDGFNHMKWPGEEFIRFLYSRPSYSLPRQAVFRRLKALLCLQAGQELSRDADDSGLVVMTAPSVYEEKTKKKMRWHDIPVGEQLTVQIPLYNSWKVPLVLTDVHLLWQASFTSNASSESGVILSNEEVNLERLREARNYVHTSVLNEFYMLPGDRKLVELGLQPRRSMIDLQITGVAFKLDVSSSRQLSLADLPSPATPPPLSSSLELLTTTPKLDVSMRATEFLRDPLDSTNLSANSLTSGGLTSIVQGKVRFSSAPTDPRFHWNVVSPQALLKVAFGGLPQSLFEGEIYGHSLTFTNIGSRELKNLYVTTSWPSFFLLSNASPSLVMSLSGVVPLEASQSKNEQFWIRAPPAQMRRLDRSLRRENSLAFSQPPVPPFCRFHVVFGYTTKAEPSELRYLQHEASLQLLPALHFSATCARTQGSEVDSLVITLRCKNVSLQHSFNVVQLACLDVNWNIHLVAPREAAASKNGVLMLPTREMTFCVRATRRKPATTEAAGVGSASSIALHPVSDGIDALATPYAQFFLLSTQAAQMDATRCQTGNSANGDAPTEVAAPETDLQPKNFFLLAFWQVVDQSDSLVKSQRFGQSHIRVVYAHMPKALQPPSGNNLAQMLASIPSLLPLSSLLRLRLYHPFRVVHNFTRRSEECTPGLSSTVESSAMAAIPVTVEIYNASSCPVTARISTNEDSISRSPAIPQQTLPPRVLWTGACVQQVALAAGQIHRLALIARVACPGVYEVNSLCLKASVSPSSTSPLPPPSRPHSNNISYEGGVVLPTGSIVAVSNPPAPFVRQLCDFSSLVAVVAAEAS
ncbi:EF HAND 1 calcium binding site [Echinococcus multilocularis]|uniref:EF HAND 1 calcium binding site n=1 Tax=Echinococcus multilocularis TaxID=6211 RepID=A0A068YFF4_ECHMU|nr:EF HAND 1 calcium binding site [Echinococcus multilocularis]